MIVPLGGAYLELIAVVDVAEAARRPTSMRVARAVESGRSFAVWVVRTEDLDAARAQLLRQGLELPEIGHGARRRPDGVELTWRMQELVRDAALSPLPFLIEWRVAPGDHPGAAAVAHPCGATGVVAVTLSDPDPMAARVRLRTVLCEGVEHDVVPGAPGVVAVTLDTPNGRLTLR
jgi:Glyoxalase-like domain